MDKIKKLVFSTLLFLFLRHFSLAATTKVNIKNCPSQVLIGQEFNVDFDIVNDFISSDNYYIKGRIGSSSAVLTKGETYNPLSNNWFSDSSSWENFPTINMNNNLIASSSVKLRPNQNVFIGNNWLNIRINKNSKNYDSSSSAIIIIEPSPEATPTEIIPTSTVTTTSSSIIASPALQPTPISYNNIFISEVMVNPETGNNEWVEIFNNNDFSLSLVNWYIDDIENSGSSPRLFSLDLPAQSYQVFDLTSSMFNNDGDNVRLLDFNKNLKDGFEYSFSTQGKSWGRKTYTSDSFCLQEPSRGLANSFCLDPTLTPTLINNAVTTITKSPTIIGKRILVNQKQTKPAVYLPPRTNNLIQKQGEVLGEINNRSAPSLLIKILSVNSFIHSLLSGLVILLKIKRQ